MSTERIITERIKTEKIPYRFTIHAFRKETDGKLDQDGVEVEHTRKLPSFNWLNTDYQGAYNHAVNIGQENDFYPPLYGYYGHWAE